MDGDRDVEHAELETELERARALDIEEIADAIESIGFSCTRCGACCTSHDNSEGEREKEEELEREQEREDHTATIFPDEVRELQGADTEWRDVARPIPYGLSEGPDGLEGETFEWALQTDACGDCVYYAEDDHGTGECTAHANRPLICQTYPFSVALGGTSQPMGDAVDSAGIVRAHECEGLGRDIDRDDAEALAATLKERAIRELEETIAVRDAYDPTRPSRGEIIVHDSEGTKHPDGTPR